MTKKEYELIRDSRGWPVPQYESATGEPEEAKGSGGASFVAVVKPAGVAQRVTLTPSQESVLDFVDCCVGFDIINYGPGAVYVDIDSEAAIDGADDVLLEPMVAWEAPGGTTVHIIGESASVVQVVGVR